MLGSVFRTMSPHLTVIEAQQTSPTWLFLRRCPRGLRCGFAHGSKEGIGFMRLAQGCTLVRSSSTILPITRRDSAQAASLDEQPPAVAQQSGCRVLTGQRPGIAHAGRSVLSTTAQTSRGSSGRPQQRLRKSPSFVTPVLSRPCRQVQQSLARVWARPPRTDADERERERE